MFKVFTIHEPPQKMSGVPHLLFLQQQKFRNDQIQAQKAAELAALKPCKFEGCKLTTSRGDYCTPHFKQLKHVCPGCQKKSTVYELCSTCYRQQNAQICETPGCGNLCMWNLCDGCFKQQAVECACGELTLARSGRCKKCRDIEDSNSPLCSACQERHTKYKNGLCSYCFNALDLQTCAHCGKRQECDENGFCGHCASLRPCKNNCGQWSISVFCNSCFGYLAKPCKVCGALTANSNELCSGCFHAKKFNCVDCNIAISQPLRCSTCFEAFKKNPKCVLCDYRFAPVAGETQCKRCTCECGSAKSHPKHAQCEECHHSENPTDGEVCLMCKTNVKTGSAVCGYCRSQRYFACKQCKRQQRCGLPDSVCADCRPPTTKRPAMAPKPTSIGGIPKVYASSLKQALSEDRKYTLERAPQSKATKEFMERTVAAKSSR